MKKGQRSVRPCKCGCGQPVKEMWHNGRFKGYQKYAPNCKPSHTHWTPEQRERWLAGVQKASDIRELPDFSRRPHKTGPQGKTYWIMKLPLGDPLGGGVNGAKHWAYEHRYVMEKALGRRLERGEHVHHINGDTLDNRPENLMVMGHSDHQRVTRLEQQGKPFTSAHTCPCCGLYHEPPLRE